jgi:hypothetical protein
LELVAVLKFLGWLPAAASDIACLTMASSSGLRWLFNRSLINKTDRWQTLLFVCQSVLCGFATAFALQDEWSVAVDWQ